MKKILLSISFIAILFMSCTEPNEDLVQTPDRNNSIEVKIEVIHQNKIDVLKTVKDVWVNNKLTHSFVNYDTLPSLGNTLTTLEDEEGNEKQVFLPKDYEIYITVK